VVRSLFDQGATFSLPNIQAQFEETQRLVSDVERQIGERVELRVIASASSSSPIPLHFDSPDLLILQIDGEKEWSFFGDPVPGSGRYRTLDEPPRDISARVLMRRGDVLFMPSGLHHQCQAEGDSLHLAISIYRRTGMDFLDHLRSQAADDPGFSDGLPNRVSDEAIAEREAQLKGRLIRLIEAADLRAFLRGRRTPQ
jgi:ribosomal protein L16 Arg81 hydroxylase